MNPAQPNELKYSFSNDELVALFSYTAEEQEAFPYLKNYMRKIEASLPEIAKDREKLQRFALAGLFLTYRAFNHTGDEFSTSNRQFVEPIGILDKRLLVFRVCFVIEISDSLHYLRLIGLKSFGILLTLLRIKNISRHLFRFVMC